MMDWGLALVHIGRVGHVEWGSQSAIPGSSSAAGMAVGS